MKLYIRSNNSIIDTASGYSIEQRSDSDFYILRSDDLSEIDGPFESVEDAKKQIKLLTHKQSSKLAYSPKKYVVFADGTLEPNGRGFYWTSTGGRWTTESEAMKVTYETAIKLTNRNGRYTWIMKKIS